MAQEKGDLLHRSPPGCFLGMDETILDRIAFGGVKELEELYQQ
jgi:hypothetical protein